MSWVYKLPHWQPSLIVHSVVSCHTCKFPCEVTQFFTSSVVFAVIKKPIITYFTEWDVYYTLLR